ncbi:MAG: DUF4349 domain-containing protein [Christensenellales bacterium]|jgi:hypothetical protein
MQRTPLRRILLLILIFLAVSIVWTGCSSAKDSATVASQYDGEYAARDEMGMAAPAATAAPVAGGAEPAYGDMNAAIEPAPDGGMSVPVSQIEQKKLIRNDYLSAQSKDPAQAAAAVEDFAIGSGGYLLNKDISYDADGKSRYAHISVRVPAGQADSISDLVASLGKIMNANSDTQDVTEQYYDLETRIKQAQAEEEALVELLKKAETVEDTLAVRTQLLQVRSSIESMQGQLNRLKELVGFDTVYVEFYPELELVSEREDDGRFMTQGEFWSGLTRGFNRSVRFVVNGLGYVGIFLAHVALPLGIVAAIVLVVVLITAPVRKRRRKLRQQASAEAPKLPLPQMNEDKTP